MLGESTSKGELSRSQPRPQKPLLIPQKPSNRLAFTTTARHILLLGTKLIVRIQAFSDLLGVVACLDCPTDLLEPPLLGRLELCLEIGGANARTHKAFLLDRVESQERLVSDAVLLAKIRFDLEKLGYRIFVSLSAPP